MGRSRYKITDQQAPHFVTFTVLHWIPVFTRVETANILQLMSSDDYPKNQIGFV